MVRPFSGEAKQLVIRWEARHGGALQHATCIRMNEGLNTCCVATDESRLLKAREAALVCQPVTGTSLRGCRLLKGA